VADAHDDERDEAVREYVAAYVTATTTALAAESKLGELVAFAVFIAAMHGEGERG